MKKLRNWLFQEDWADRIQLWISLFLQLALVGALWEGKWLVSFTAVTALALTFLPGLVERQFRLQLPIEFTLVNCLFLYAALGLGDAQRFYDKFWWWDIMLHSISALVIGLIGFLVVYVFYRTKRIHMAPFYVAMVSFGFAVTLGVMWEIFEFGMDWSFGLNLQQSGLVDTMTDLMVDTLGALAAAWIGYAYVKDGDSMIADRIVRRFVEKNPRIFRRRRRRKMLSFGAKEPLK